MESPLLPAMERKVSTTSKHDLMPVTADKMNSSINSTLEDTTPSDSGVQLLDSESSELMVESITSQNGFDFEETRPLMLEKEIKKVQRENTKAVNEATVDSNFNVTTAAQPVEDTMTTSACSTFDTTENIVYRRKVRTTAAVPRAPKKRVSFHEDILKNTRTDNIHIEHGFITYKNGRKMATHVGAAGRYSWCSEGDGAAGNDPTELCAQPNDGEDDAADRRRQRVVYRNACSDVLDYGNSDVYDSNERNILRYEHSGVFEYLPSEGVGTAVRGALKSDDDVNKRRDEEMLYKCSCSSSSSSLDSDENDKNSNRHNYEQAKSSSCDCIGINNVNNNLIGENCYFSEPNIDNLSGKTHKKSVWNKEKKPKSSCLKNTKCHTNIIHEQDLTTKVKKFNVHDMNQLFDNSSKVIFGSLKSIFTMPLPERGVPEGSEDLQAVAECVPEMESTPEHRPRAEVLQNSPPLKPKPFLSKSLDGSKQQQGVKKFVHNVDEQLRHKNSEELYAPTRQSSAETIEQQREQRTLQRQEEIDGESAGEEAAANVAQQLQQQFRNKFIINCESTVFEHTGVSYSYEKQIFNESVNESDTRANVVSFGEKNTPIAQSGSTQLHSSSFIGGPLAKTFTNFFRSLKDSSTTRSTPIAVKRSAQELAADQQQQLQATESYFALKMHKEPEQPVDRTNTTANVKQSLKSLPTTTSSSTISDLSTCSSSLPPHLQKSTTSSNSTNNNNNSLAIGQDSRNNLEKQSRHLPSPLKKRGSGGNLMQLQPPRYGISSAPDNSRLSPDLCNGYAGIRGSCGRDSKSTILSEEFDDILTVTTDTDKNESDIVIVDYPEVNDLRPGSSHFANLLKVPPHPAAKTSLINRFLRNVTEKKILESSLRKNNFFAGKLKSEQRRFSGKLYVPGAKPKNCELIDDLNAEIAMEIEMSGVNSPRRELVSIDTDLPGDISRFELGIGEISIDIFSDKCLHILRDPTEQLMKVFKLYTGYSREGFMTPVLVFLTDQTLYVADLVRNRLCAKFVLAYVDLDVILMGPHGTTVLLSNSTRDMQQVLLAGGPYPAVGLVTYLELCARRGGSVLPAVGQLTFEHLAPLRAFVRENSCIGTDDAWMYYAVVNIPAGTLGCEQEPLGPHIKGFLMHRCLQERLSEAAVAKQSWKPGYFLLKAGVLYMFNDSTQKLPSWATALAECQGARRAVKTGRPHCFEVMLKGQLLQLAAPDEYVASEWLQALLQSASGLFEMQEKHKTLGCTLVVTQNHLITLREDFTAPLSQLNKNATNDVIKPATAAQSIPIERQLTVDTNSMLVSSLSTPNKCTPRSSSSINSTPTKLSQSSRGTSNGSASASSNLTANNCAKQTQYEATESYTNMCSVYGKYSGLEILSCAEIKEMTGIKIPSHNETWWCIVEFSFQEVRECTDDLVIFFASSVEMQRFLRLLEQLWQTKNNDLFPVTILDEDDLLAEQCGTLYMDINRAWEPLLCAALGYPL